MRDDVKSRPSTDCILQKWAYNTDTSVIYQRLYLYALVAAYGWPTAIAATNAVGGDTVPLPSGITPIVQGARRGRQQVQQQQRQQQPARQADNWLN